MKDKKFVLQWVPSLTFAALSVVFGIVYTFTKPEPALTVYLQLIGGAVACVLFPVAGLVLKRDFPPLYTIVVGLLVFFGIYFGKAADMYTHIPHYDKFLHTNFGLLGAVTVYAFIQRWGGGKMNFAGTLILCILATLGLGAIWEIFEYYCSVFVAGEDPQGVWLAVQQIIAAGGEKVVNPLDDTIGDLMVTLIGSSIFCIICITDKCFGEKFLKKLYNA